jgi:phage terminase large subunit-like protein
MPASISADPVLQYAQAVVDRRIVAGPLVRKAGERHLADLERGPGRGLIWRPDRALRAIEFFADVLRLPDVEKDPVSGDEIIHFEDAEPFKLDLWQQFVVGSLFGWYWDDVARRFRVGYIEVGKGNGKTPMAAGIGLYMQNADGQPKAECYAAAAVKDQAKIQYRDAVNMVQASEDLRELVEQHGEKEVYNLVNRKTGSFYKPISAEKRGLDGKRVHYAGIDEVHEHTNDLVCNKMRAGTKGRRSALILEITNSGFDRTTVCYQHHEYSDRVLSGQVPLADSDSWFAYVCSLDEGDDPMVDEACWPKANPNLGVSIQTRYLRDQVSEARGMPSKESIVRRLNFCQWVDAESPWIDSDLWRACEKDFDLEELRGRRGYGGLDLSGTRDLTAHAMAFQREDGGVDAFVEFWTPAITLAERSKADKVPYDVWVKQGHVRSTPGRAVDYAFVAQRLGELKEIYDFDSEAFDPYRIKYFETELAEAAIELRLVPHSQGYFKASDKEGKEKAKASGEEPAPDLWMPRSVELLEDLVMKGLLRVKLNPCLRWNSASAVLKPDPKNNRIFDKLRSKGRIDGIVALAMAIGLALNGEAEAPKTEPQLFFI